MAKRTFNAEEQSMTATGIVVSKTVDGEKKTLADDLTVVFQYDVEESDIYDLATRQLTVDLQRKWREGTLPIPNSGSTTEYAVSELLEASGRDPIAALERNLKVGKVSEEDQKRLAAILETFRNENN